MGVPVVATSWLGTVVATTDVSTTLIAVANPSATQTATVTISVHSKGSVVAVTAAKSVRIAPGQRLVLNLASVTVGTTDASVQVETDRPVVVGQWMTTTTPMEIQTISNFPLLGTESLPVDVFTPDQAVAESVSVRSDDTVVPESTTTTAVVTTTTIAGATTTVVAGATTTTLR